VCTGPVLSKVLRKYHERRTQGVRREIFWKISKSKLLQFQRSAKGGVRGLNHLKEQSSGEIVTKILWRGVFLSVLKVKQMRSSWPESGSIVIVRYREVAWGLPLEALWTSCIRRISRVE
jgi:hypothetical protein